MFDCISDRSKVHKCRHSSRRVQSARPEPELRRQARPLERLRPRAAQGHHRGVPEGGGGQEGVASQEVGARYVKEYE